MRSKQVMGCVVVVMLLAVGAIADERNDTARATAKVAKGETLLEKEDYAKAERMFRDAIRIKPTMPTAHLGLGTALLGQRRYHEALATLTEAERHYTDYQSQLWAAQTQGMNMVESGKEKSESFQETHGVFQQVPHYMGMEPDAVGLLNVDEAGVIPAQLYYLQGMALLRTDQEERGIEKLQQCLARNEAHGLAHYNLSVALLTRGKIEQARLHLDAAIAAGVQPHPGLVADLARTPTNRLHTASVDQ